MVTHFSKSLYSPIIFSIIIYFIPYSMKTPEYNYIVEDI